VRSEWRTSAVSLITGRPTTGSRLHAAESGAGQIPLSLSALDLWAFVVPAVSFIQIAVVGQLILSEILMLVMLPWLWSARDRHSLPRWFLVLWAGWLLSQVVTDVVVGSAFEDFARGWAAIIFTITDFAAILVLASTPRRARLFALGLAAGGVLGYFIVPVGFALGDPWKFALAVPVGFALATCLSGRAASRLPWLTIGAMLLFGAFNLVFGFRSLGGVSLLTAGYLILSAIAGRPKAARTRSMLRASAGLVFLTVAVVGVLQLYDAAASGGLLGPAAQAKYIGQSGQLGVLLGGRPEILASAQAIIDSPVLGHGSWARDVTYSELLVAQLSSLNYGADAPFYGGDLIPAHSYLIGSWVWAGFLGGAFWLAVLAIAAGLLANLYSFRVELAPLLVFSTMLLLWNIAFSPYGAGARILACYGIALCLLGLRQVRRFLVDLPPRRRAAWTSRSPRHPSQGWGDCRAPAGSDSRPAPDRAGSEL
jgi:hypothetical protein